MPAQSDQPLSLTGRGITHLASAKNAATGCHVQTVHQGEGLHHLLISIVAGHALGEHESPGEATLLVLHGHIELADPIHTTTGQAGEMLLVPNARHNLRAVQDSIVLLTIARRHGGKS